MVGVGRSGGEWAEDGGALSKEIIVGRSVCSRSSSARETVANTVDPRRSGRRIWDGTY